MSGKEVVAAGDANRAPNLANARRGGPVAVLALAIRHWWPLFLLAVILSMAANLAYGPGLALVLKTFTDAVLLHNKTGVTQAAWGMAGIALVMGLGSFLASYVACRLSENVSLAFRKAIVGRVLKASCAYHNAHPSGDAVSCLENDVESGKQAVTAFHDLVSDVLLIGFSLVNLFAWSWPIAVAVLLLALLCGITGTAYAGRVRQASDSYQDNLARMTETAASLFSGLAVAKSLEKETILADKFKDVSLAQYRTGRFRARLLALQAGLSRLAPEISSVGLLLVAGIMVFTRRITPGQAVGLSQLGSLILWPLASLGEKWTCLQQHLAGMERVVQAMDVPQEDDSGAEDGAVYSIPVPTLSGGAVDGPLVSFQAVSFGYSAGNQVLFGVDFAIRHGQKAAITGPSGSGKSTLGSLMLRFYDPGEGVVALSGQDVRQMPLERLRRMIAWVPQNPWIFPGTIRDNITLGNPGATMEEVVQATRAAHIHDFIAGLPDGYDTRLDERGQNLSGGQKQRICLARAFLKQAPILLMDEPTSSVDPESERLIADAVKGLQSGKTVITISHTNEMIADADLTLAVQDGRVVASLAASEAADAG